MGRKPRWQSRWEHRSQQRFDQQSVDAKIWQTRNADVHAPDGTHYIVRTVPNGQPLREPGGYGDTSGLEIPVMIAFSISAAVRTRLRTGWTIGVLTAGTAWRGEKVVFKETVIDESAIEARVRELADAITKGTSPDRESL